MSTAELLAMARQLYCCMSNWKTTGMGFMLLTISALEMAGYTLDHIHSDPLPHLLAAVGLIFAKDASK